MEEIDRYSGCFREEKGFLVVEGAVDHGDSFDIKMLLNNQIAGILPLQIQYIDNQCIYRYLTGEKISLTRFLSHQKLHFKDAYRLCKDIFHISASDRPAPVESGIYFLGFYKAKFLFLLFPRKGRGFGNTD